MSDVLVLGGGPAGAAVGAYLSRAGVANTILEAAVHPRPHVGESLVPATTRVLSELDLLGEMERAGFCKKYGASWHPPQRLARVSIRFADFPQPGVHQPYSYHVDRAVFDHMLLRRAEALGSRVHQGARAERVLFDGDRACGVRAVVGDRTLELPARLVVDATGRSTLLGRQLRKKRSDPSFDQLAVHGWFEGVDRGPAETEGDVHTFFLPVERGWAWQIPITATATSVGIVAERRAYREAGLSPEAWFEHLKSSTPDFARAMRRARCVRALALEADYSYLMTELCGDGWLLVGDAARFVDPIFSSGVSVALTSAKFASEAIVRAVRRDDVSREALRPYERRVSSGIAVWYEFIRLYYKLQPLFTHLITSEAHRAEIHRLLQGDVFDRTEAPVLSVMRDYIREVERTEGHLLRTALDPALDVVDAPEREPEPR